MISVNAQRAHLQRPWPAEFADGERSAFHQRHDGPRELGGYPKGFNHWPLERRNAWYCGFNFGRIQRLQVLMELADG
jgi:hypothetical protein